MSTPPEFAQSGRDSAVTDTRPNCAPDRPGILLTAFGGPDSLEAVGPFMARLMGREPSPELVERARAKYEAIGGKSPLTEIALRISGLLERELASQGHPVPVRLGMRYWDPLISDAVHELIEIGANRIVMVSLSPFESKVSCGAYRAAAREALSGLEINDVRESPALHTAPGYREFLGHACRHALEAAPGEKPLLVMTAHSLPVADLVEDDPYVAGLHEVAAAVAQAAELGGAEEIDSAELGVATFGSLSGRAPWVLAYQSKGARPGDWLEPDIDVVMDAAAAAGYDTVVICPIGFATDHMETMYDLDIVASNRAADLGLRFVRACVPNDDELLIAALAGLAVQALQTRD
ncbi:MAG: ferrochelatase [Actinomycetota bacterium]|nr:ferrochelatase [Actinomycetota bacterium]